MTVEPSQLVNETISPKRVTILEDIFELGYARSRPIKVYADPQTGMEVVVLYRTLTPVELREVFEKTNEYQNPVSQVITEKIETLARAISYINNMPLILDPKDRENYVKKNNREPTSLDMAREILLEKIKSYHVIDLLYAEYQNFLDEVKKHFEDVKKKLKNPASSN